MAKKKEEVKQIKTINIVVKTSFRQKLSKKEAIEDYDNFVKEFTVLNIHNKSKAITLLKSKRDNAMERYHYYGKLLGIDTTTEYNKHGAFAVNTTSEPNEIMDEKKANKGHFAYWQEMAERLNKFWFMLKPEEKVKPPKKEAPLFKEGKINIAKQAFENAIEFEKVAEEKITPTHIKSAYTAFVELDILSERTHTNFIRKFGSMYGLKITSGKSISITNTPNERKRTDKIKTEYNKLKSKLK